MHSYCVCTIITKLVKRHFIYLCMWIQYKLPAVRADHLAIGSIYSKLSMCMTSQLCTSHIAHINYCTVYSYNIVHSCMQVIISDIS